MRIRVDEDFIDAAQICLNGHVVNDSSHSYPKSNQDYCEKCGVKTITECQQCKTEIKGFHHMPGAIRISDYDRPAFCQKCGQAFPWTSKRIDAARQLADELENLTPEDKDELKRSLDDLVKDTPFTPVAEARFKKIMKRSGREVVDAMRSALTDVLSEAARKAIFGA